MASYADKFLRERSDDIIDVKKAIGKFEVGRAARAWRRGPGGVRAGRGEALECSWWPA